MWGGSVGVGGGGGGGGVGSCVTLRGDLRDLAWRPCMQALRGGLA